MSTATQEKPLEKPPVKAVVKEEPKAPEPEPYKMPECKTGRIVIWRAAGDGSQTKGVVMIVTKVGFNAISGSLIGEDRGAMGPVNGVRHITDPECRFFEQGGTWEDTDDVKLLNELKKLLS